jgi:hypothetical protein
VAIKERPGDSDPKMGDGRRETGLELLRNQGLLTEAAGRLETKPASDGRTTKGKTGLRGVREF